MSQRALVPVLVAITVVLVLQWIASYRQIEAFRSTIMESTGQFSRDLERQRLAIQAGIAGLKSRLAAVSAELSRQSYVVSPSLASEGLHAAKRVEEDEEPVESIDDDPWDELSSLPELPVDFDARRFLRGTKYSLADLVADPRINPEGKELNRVERLEAIEALSTAHAREEILESQIQSALAREMEGLREAGAYVDFPPGASYGPAEPEVLTSGERAPDGGMRLFYFYPDEFPEISAKRDRKSLEAERAVRTVLSILAQSES